MDFETLQIAIDDTGHGGTNDAADDDRAVTNKVATLTLNRPDRLNSLNPTLMKELIAASDHLSKQWDVAVVIIEGAGRAFCAGADLKEIPVLEALPASGRSWAERREIGQLGLRMVEAVEGIRQITIARLHGAAIGGGLLLAAACDLRVATKTIRMSIPEVQLGIPLAWGGIPRMVREFGPALTKELVITCREFSAQEAREAGFLNRVVDEEVLDAQVAELASAVAAMPGAPVAITKEHVNAVARGMSSAHLSFADGDVLTGTVMDPESAAAARRYIESTLPK